MALGADIGEIVCWRSAALSGEAKAGELREYLENGSVAMSRLGFIDAMLNEEPSAILNSTGVYPRFCLALT